MMENAKMTEELMEVKALLTGGMAQEMEAAQEDDK